MGKLVLVLAMLFALRLHAATFTSGAPRSTDNNGSCGIALLPAATLLLPLLRSRSHRRERRDHALHHHQRLADVKA
jgi:hypothetical protein